jgi:hypothetical protein
MKDVYIFDITNYIKTMEMMMQGQSRVRKIGIKSCIVDSIAESI